MIATAYILNLKRLHLFLKDSKKKHEHQVFKGRGRKERGMEKEPSLQSRAYAAANPKFLLALNQPLSFKLSLNSQAPALFQPFLLVCMDEYKVE